MISTNINFDSLWKHYPGDSYSSGQVYLLIGGKVYQNYLSDPIKYENSCALRLSHALNKAGIQIPSTKGKTGSGSNGNWYFYRVADLEEFLNSRFGVPDISGTSKTNFQTFKGIILFRVTGWSNATGHVTLWDGAKVAQGDYFNKASSTSLWKIS